MDTELTGAIAAERRDLAAVLSGLPAGRWDEPSLCAGWRVREVVAHLTMPFRYSMPRFLAQLAKDRGDFTKMADRVARRDAESLSASELAACLKDNADHPWKPPGGGLQGALTHDVVHGLDITVPLGLGRKVPEDRLRIVLDGFRKPKAAQYFGVDLTGIELRADDLEWTFGSGEPLSGAAQDLLMVLCGRTLPPGRLSGEAATRFSS